MTQRAQWINYLKKIISPVLLYGALDRLTASMPVNANTSDRKYFTVLEAVGRTICGSAPWLSTTDGADLARAARDTIVHLTDPQSQDFFEFSNQYGNQPLVDAAFLSMGLLRAPQTLWEPLTDTEKKNVLRALKKTRSCSVYHNNWLLFAAMVETFFYFAGEEYDKMRIDYAITAHMNWYKGNGFYGDGPEFHFDYYNSFVIHPMLTTIAKLFEGQPVLWADAISPIYDNAAQYAIHLERLIAPDGTYPAIGRSLAYRFGAFHHLAHLAYEHRLPPELPPSQVREALFCVIQTALSYSDLFTKDGWLSVGLSGHDPSIGESYISTGSLYLCTTAFLPLGLPEDDPFWSDPAIPFTGKRMWRK